MGPNGSSRTIRESLGGLSIMEGVADPANAVFQLHLSIWFYMSLTLSKLSSH
jgi:hypothetical protein